MHHPPRAATLITSIVGAVVLAPTFALAAFNVDLRYGDTGSEVVKLQQFLTVQGLFAGEITGNFYAITLGAVQAFQNREDITPASGFFGPLTRARANTPVQSGASDGSNVAASGTSSKVSEIQLLLQQIQALRDEIARLKGGSSSSNTSTSPASCSMGGITLSSGASHTFYNTTSPDTGDSCSARAQMRTCSNGVLSGEASYSKTSCTNPGTSSSNTASNSCSDSATQTAKANSERDMYKSQYDVWKKQYETYYDQYDYSNQLLTYWKFQSEYLYGQLLAYAVSAPSVTPFRGLSGAVYDPSYRPSTKYPPSTIDNAGLCDSAKTTLASAIKDRDAWKASADSMFDSFAYYYIWAPYYKQYADWYKSVYDAYVGALLSAGHPTPAPFTFTPTRK